MHCLHTSCSRSWWSNTTRRTLTSYVVDKIDLSIFNTASDANTLKNHCSQWLSKHNRINCDADLESHICPKKRSTIYQIEKICGYSGVKICILNFARNFICPESQSIHKSNHKKTPVLCQCPQNIDSVDEECLKAIDIALLGREKHCNHIAM